MQNKASLFISPNVNRMKYTNLSSKKQRSTLYWKVTTHFRDEIGRSPLGDA